MNDRFKFRVWDKENNVYLDEGSLLDSRTGKIVGYYRDDDVFTIEQCAGLADKNGKLIFEGDVVLAFEWWSGRKREFNVIYCKKDYGFLFVDNYQNTKALFTFFSENLEIIGNIHEMEVTK